MDDDTTEDHLKTSRHISVWVDAAPEVVYEFAVDPQTWPQWAAGLAEGGLHQSADGWVADSPMGTVTVEFSPPNQFGVLDHVVRMPSGEAVYNPLRVVPGEVGEPSLRGGLHRAATAGHDRCGIRRRCRRGRSGSGHAAPVGRELNRSHTAP